MVAPPPEETQLVGQSQVFLDLMDHVSRVAPLDRPILVVGERGTGKELIAARLHFLSKRWGEAFVKLNCAAIPETLIESELFGHEPGAFTGARDRRAGRFEMADGGTLFLDEIATMSQAAQEKLLRIIEYGQFERVGGTETINVDVRVVGATNVDLPALADQGKFRHDLLDRLAFDVLTIPPLRARRSDIMNLADHFARAIVREQELESFQGFTAEAEALILAHPWPGNVREIKNVVERAVYAEYAQLDPDGLVDEIIFDPFESPYRPEVAKPGILSSAPESGSVVTASPSAAPSAVMPIDLRATVAGIEKALLAEALQVNKHNQRETAGHLSLSYDQLRHGLKKHSLL